MFAAENRGDAACREDRREATKPPSYLEDSLTYTARMVLSRGVIYVAYVTDVLLSFFSERIDQITSILRGVPQNTKGYLSYEQTL